MRSSESLIDDLEEAIRGGSHERRAEILRSVTELFLGSVDQFSHAQVDFFDDVLCRLSNQVEHNILIELAAKLAPVEKAPPKVIGGLARDDAIEVAGPVLASSSVLSDGDLIEIARTKSQAHLGAISERERIAAVVTDILVERGDADVVRKLSRNQGASFSDDGFVKLANRAESDGVLAENLAMRLDLPPPLLMELVSKATEAVRVRLMALVPPECQDVLQDLLASASVKTLRDAVAPRDFKQAVALIDKLQDSKQLDEAAIVAFATACKYEEMVVSVARLCAAPLDLIERLMQNSRHDGVLVACKAAGLHWPAFKAILTNRFSHSQISTADLERARTDFLKLSAVTAQRMFRFWLIRGVTKENVKQPA